MVALHSIGTQRRYNQLDHDTGIKACIQKEKMVDWHMSMWILDDIVIPSINNIQMTNAGSSTLQSTIW